MSRGDYPGGEDSNKFYVLRIEEKDGIFDINIIKTITCDLPQASYNGSWICDCLNEKLYLYTMLTGDWRVTEAEGNRFVIYEFKMFDATDPRDITLTNDDVTKELLFDYMSFQGGTCWGGMLFIPIEAYKKINGVFPGFFGGWDEKPN